MRVTAQLIEAQTGHHLWAERYDCDLADVFALQDEMAQRIVTNIAPLPHSGGDSEGPSGERQRTCAHMIITCVPSP